MNNKETNNPKEKQIFITFTKNAAMGCGTSILVMLALFFFLGTLVGRGMIRVDMGQDGLFLEISGLTEAESRENLSEMGSIPEEASDFVFYKELNKEAPEEKPTTPDKPHEKNKSVVKREKTIIKPAMVEKAAIQETPAARPEPVKAATPVKPIAPPEKSNPELFKYTIQAGSFRTSEDADKMVAKLGRLGYPAFWVKGLVRGNETWYRVRIGAFKDRMDAESSLTRLKHDNIDAIFVKR